MASSEKTGAPTESSECYLLGLPPELRNLIYEYALTEGYVMFYSGFEEDGGPYRKAPYEEPGILSTCRQIRSEAMPVFYLSNNFFIKCRKWHTGKIIALEEKCMAMGVRDKMEVEVEEGCDFDWSMMEMWYKHLHGGGLWYPRYNCDLPVRFCNMNHIAAFEMAKVMRDTTWSTCERVLRTFWQTVEL